MELTDCAADTRCQMLSGVMQPGRLVPGMSLARQMTGTGTRCYTGLTVSDVKHAIAVPGNLCVRRRLRLRRVTEEPRLSTSSTREGHLPGVRAQRCRRPLRIHRYRRVALPTFDRSVGGPRSKCRRTTLPRHRAGPFARLTTRATMAVHGQRKPPISVAPGWNLPGATPVAFPSIREIPRGPSSLRRNGRARHRMRRTIIALRRMRMRCTERIAEP